MSVKVNHNMPDQFHQCKTPRLLAKGEGKADGITAVILNVVDIAKVLNWPPMYLTKYFGCELGAQTQFDVKNDRYIVNGSPEVNKLQDMWDGFFIKLGLCPECDNPETELHVNRKKQTTGNSCKACGYRAMLDTSFSKTHLRIVTVVQERKGREKNGKGKHKEHGSVSSSEAPLPPPPKDINPPPHAVEEEDDDWGKDTTEEIQRTIYKKVGGSRGEIFTIYKVVKKMMKMRYSKSASVPKVEAVKSDKNNDIDTNVI
ncbi:Eukaryotic translation initiation factor 5 [Myotis brandtii]|uniref:Eukaryotic translation initiation factor 5 n=1 Tax=Myotis brandtii TaxID=109478 RepID=S7NZH4_MYOBR|nr:Eukaryotic translation initiation factor 5 [Myotis brandtii]